MSRACVITLVCASSCLFASTVYVSSAGDDSKSGDSPANAVRTVQRGLELARSSGGAEVKVTLGAFSGKALLMPANTTLSGGWNPSFSEQVGLNLEPKQVGAVTAPPDCGKENTCLAATQDDLVMLIKEKGIVITELLIQAPNFAGEVSKEIGRSSYGIVVDGGEATLQRTTIIAGAGGMGGKSFDGAPGGRGCARGGAGGKFEATAKNCTVKDAQPGSSNGQGGGKGGSIGGNGKWPNAGEKACTTTVVILLQSDVGDGGPGGPGGPGQPGRPGGNVAADFGFLGRDPASGGLAWRSADTGGPIGEGGRGFDGGGGGGGGRGGGGRFEWFWCKKPPMFGGAGGLGGAGACGGAGGGGGYSGGAAIGLLVANGKVLVQSRLLIFGGLGGTGGEGGSGGRGGSSEQGWAGDGGQSSNCLADTRWAGRGGDGGYGGTGGGGSGGNGGNGGPAIDVALAGSGTVQGNLSHVGGTGGEGGVGGPNGQDGARAMPGLSGEHSPKVKLPIR